jgi:SAM-dependent methyltransferase
VSYSPTGGLLVTAVFSLARQFAGANTRAAYKARHDHSELYVSLKARLEAVYGNRLREQRVLDFGCGYTYPVVVLLQEDVREIIGLDVAPVFRDGWRAIFGYCGGFRKPGGGAHGLLHYYQATCYHRHLQRCVRRTIRHTDCRIQRYDGDRLPFADGGFDCIVSNAVLQELPDPLERFAAEMARVLAPGGRIDLEWHNFYSLRGDYQGGAESQRRPWSHLLEGSYHPDLNRKSPEQVRAAFAPYFEELQLLGHDRHHRIAGQDPDFEPEGADLLTPELRERLSNYPEEWLLTRGYILQGRRR